MVRGARGWLWAIGALGLSGCGGPSATLMAPDQAFRGVTLKAGVVGDQALLETVTSALRGEWEATRGAHLEIQTAPRDPQGLRGFDVLLFPGDLLGSLVDARILMSLPEKVVFPPAPREPDETPRDQTEAPVTDLLQFSDILPAYREQVTRYGKDRMGLPYGGSALVLVYHRAAFERVANRAAAGNEQLMLEPPSTWTRFDALVRFFHARDWDGDGATDYGVALALGPDAEGVGDALYLARAASLGQHRDQYSFLFDSDSMTPRIDAPPFVEALQGLVALKEYGPPGLARFDAESARSAFRKGNVALLIDRAERAGRWSQGKAVGVARLPGSERVYDPARRIWENASPPNRPSYLPIGGGWLVGVSPAAGDRQREAVLDFAKYLVCPEVSNRVGAGRAFPMLPVRMAQLRLGSPDPRSAPGVESRSWADAVSRTLAAARVIPSLRIPEADGYLSDLTTGRVAAMQGEPAERALKSVAQAWTARTEKLGTARQLWHYRRSLNSLVTTPEPPGNSFSVISRQ